MLNALDATNVIIDEQMAEMEIAGEDDGSRRKLLNSWDASNPAGRTLSASKAPVITRTAQTSRVSYGVGGRKLSALGTAKTAESSKAVKKAAVACCLHAAVGTPCCITCC